MLKKINCKEQIFSIRSLFLCLSVNLVALITFAQVGIGTITPDPSAQLDITSTNKGFLLPRMTNQQRNGIPKPSEGLMIYNTSTRRLEMYTGDAWNDFKALLNTASNGLTNANAEIELGNTLGGTEAQLKSDREIPLAAHELRITQNGAGFLGLAGNGTDAADAIIRFTDDLPSPKGRFRGRTWLQFNPLEKDQGSAPFLFTQTSTKYGSWQPNEGFMMGWNLAPGGGAYMQGLPGVGISMEQHFKPEDAGPGFTEMHDFWIKPDGVQLRLRSYTLNNGSGDVDYYHTVSRQYMKDPLNTSRIWYTLDQGPTDVKQLFEPINGRAYAWLYENDGIQLSMPAYTTLNLSNSFITHLPSFLSHQEYNEFFKDALPLSDNSLSLGGFTNRWADGSFVKLRSNHMQLRAQALEHPRNDPVTKVLDVQDNSGGVLLPRLSQAEINAIPRPATGELLFNVETSQYQQFTSGGWKTLGASSGEDVTLISANNYTVLPSNGLLQNLIYENATGGGTIVLPAVSTDKMTLYVSNTSIGVLNFSERLYSNSTTFTSVVTSGEKVKIIYQRSTGRWYLFKL
ncbi:MAG: hypothetical protein WKF97_22930 [Chitinophagaceae bacterium]